MHSDLAELVDAMRVQATHRPQPSPELAAVLSEGLTIDPSEQPVPAAQDAEPGDNAPDQADEAIPDEVPAGSSAPEDVPHDGEDGQEAGAFREPARG